MLDLLFHRAEDLLACVELDPLPCRTVVHPGPTVPFDVCERSGDRDGQLWVAINAVTPGWPTPTGAPSGCAEQFTIEWELGVVRCAATLDDSGRPPDPSEIAADAAQQLVDAQVLREAFLCCWPQQGRSVIADRWDAIPPAGGCVGGVWTFRTTEGI